MRALFVLTLLIPLGLFSQSNSNTSFSDTSYLIKDSTKVHSPKKAVLFSAILPGAGQVYNHTAMPKGKRKAFWKVPLIYAGLGASTYFFLKKQSLQKELKTEYQLRLDTGFGTEKWNDYDDQGILVLFDQELNRRDMSILLLGLVYIIQLVDAGVEAHFVSFDVSKDLTMSFEPTVFNNQNIGLKLSLNFR